MNITKEVNRILGISDSYEAPAKIMSILYDKEKREKTFREFTELFNYNINYDWFTDYFQDEHADRKNKKQDFTPRGVNTLITQLTGSEYNGTHYEPCAGTGGMTIAAWDRDRKKHSPFDYRPSWYVYTCEELSDRTIPFLLFNLILRGMNAVVVQCDVLTRKAKGAFFIQNETDDHFHYSSFNVLPYSQAVASHLAVTWEEEKYTPHVESKDIPAHIIQPTARGEVSEFTKVVYYMTGVSELPEVERPRKEVAAAVEEPAKEEQYEQMDLIDMLSE